MTISCTELNIKFSGQKVSKGYQRGYINWWALITLKHIIEDLRLSWQREFYKTLRKNRWESDLSQRWWHMPIIIALRRLMQENHEFETSLGYVVRPCLNKQINKSYLHIPTECRTSICVTFI
jgi:hypothetical protein